MAPDAAFALLRNLCDMQASLHEVGYLRHGASRHVS